MSERKPKYHTTKVPAGRSIEEIRKLLQEEGAERFTPMEDYTTGQVGVQFVHDGHGVQLLIDISSIKDKLETLTRASKKARGLEGARRIAYRLVLNWLQNNFELVRWGVFEPAEVFLPFYLIGPGETVADRMVKFSDKGALRLALPPAKEEG